MYTDYSDFGPSENQKYRYTCKSQAIAQVILDTRLKARLRRLFILSCKNFKSLTAPIRV